MKQFPTMQRIRYKDHGADKSVKRGRILPKALKAVLVGALEWRLVLS